MGIMILTVAEHGQVDIVHQDDGVLEAAVGNCHALPAVQNGSTTVGIETIHVAWKAARLALQLGGSDRLSDLGDVNRLRSLGVLRCLGRSHAGLGMCRELDLVHVCWWFNG